MRKHLFVKRLFLPRSADTVFAWHELPETFERLIPAGDPVRIVERSPGLQSPIGDGARVVLSLGHSPLTIRWVARHEGFIRGRQFIDVQEHGPFKFWRHLHSFLPEGDCGSTMEDHVEYALPFGWLGETVAHDRVRDEITRIFAWRHRVTRMLVPEWNPAKAESGSN